MKKKIKVGFLTERMLLGFGVDLVIHKTATELVEQGFDVTVFCIRSDGTYGNEKYNLVELNLPLSKNPAVTEWNAFKVLKNLNHEDIDIWIAQTYPFFIATMIMKKPVIVVDHGVISTEGLSIKKKLYFSWIKLIQNYLYFPRASKIVSISNYIKSLTPLFLRKKQQVIYNGADNYLLATEKEILEFKEKYSISEKDVVLLYVGRLNSEQQPYKGTRELVEIFKMVKKQNPHIKMIMAGFGDEKDKKWLEEEGIIPIICAPVKLMPVLYSISNVYVSASKWEGFNLPLVEAGFFSVPVVAYNIGPHGEVIRGGAGFLVNNKEEFVKAILTLADNSALIKEMGRRAKENALEFTWKKAGEKYKKVIIETINIFFQLKARKINQGKNKKIKKDLVDVIILNYNGKGYLDNLFNSLKKQTYQKIRVTVVDNGSCDGSAEYIEKNYPEINLIKSKKNLFFSRGNNLAVSKTNGEYIFFLNNDTVVKEDAIEKMVKTIKENGKYRVAAVSAKMLFKKNNKIIDSAGTVITENGSPFNRGIGQIDVGQYDMEEEVFGACFGAALVRRVIYENVVGKLDNHYFGYFEDIDWCLRARNKGYKILSSPFAVVWHDHSGSSKRKSYNWKYYLIQRNFVWTLIKNFQLKRAVKKVIWRFISLTHTFFITKDKERRWIIVKIFLHTFIIFPVLLLKRARIQLMRIAPDYSSIKFCKGEAPFFNPEKYEPYYSLDNLSLMLRRLDQINNFKNNKITRLAAITNYYCSIRDAGRMDVESWSNKIRILIKLIGQHLDIEDYYLGKFEVEIIRDYQQNHQKNSSV